jgi:hypothetical protein
MQKEEAVRFMYDSFQADNRAFALQSGLSEQEAATLIEKSSLSLMYMFGNLYDKMSEAGLIK